MPFEDTTILKYLSTALDIAVVWFIIYKLILIIRGTKAVQLLKGITVIIVVRMISIFLELRTLYWLTEQVLTWGFLAVIIIFQPELRRALEQLGRGSLFSRTGTHEDDEPEMVATAIAKATEYMGKRRIGALITLSKETCMGDYVETGIPLNANVSSELLINIFIPNTPLHDGAVIMQGSTIKAAACRKDIWNRCHSRKRLQEAGSNPAFCGRFSVLFQFIRSFPGCSFHACRRICRQ